MLAEIGANSEPQLGPFGRALLLSVAVHLLLLALLETFGIAELRFRGLAQPLPLAARLQQHLMTAAEEKPTVPHTRSRISRPVVSCKNCLAILPLPDSTAMMGVLIGIDPKPEHGSMPMRSEVDSDGVVVQEISVEDLRNPLIQPVPGTHWHYSLELDVRPFAIDDIVLERYRPFLALTPESVQVVVFIDDAGAVVAVDVRGGPDELIAEIREGLLAVRFTPGRLAGQAVPSILALEFLF